VLICPDSFFLFDAHEATIKQAIDWPGFKQKCNSDSVRPV
jgi:hypothetical protein